MTRREQLRDLWDIVDGVLRFAAAIPVGVLPRRYWSRLETRVPVSRAALLSALATIAVSAALGIPGFYSHAESNASLAIDLTLASSGWRPSPTAGESGARKVAAAAWDASFFSLFTFAFFTPLGLLCTYLGVTGAVRAISVVCDDPRGDPIVSGVDFVARRVRQTVARRRARRVRAKLEGPEVPDRLLSGAAAGFPDADFVVVASRRKPDWEAGVFVVTHDKWYRLGTPVERQMAGGLRTLSPLTALRTQEVLRRGVPYQLPPLVG